jgi:hypothetical protein
MTLRFVLYLTLHISLWSIIESTHVPHLNLWDELSHLELPDLLHVVHLNFLHHTVNVLHFIVQSDGCVASYSQMREEGSSCASTREGEGGMVISSRKSLFQTKCRQKLVLQQSPTLLHGNVEIPRSAPGLAQRAQAYLHDGLLLEHLNNAVNRLVDDLHVHRAMDLRSIEEPNDHALIRSRKSVAYIRSHFCTVRGRGYLLVGIDLALECHGMRGNHM